MNIDEIQEEIDMLIDEIDGIDLQIAEKNVWQAKAVHAKRIKIEQLADMRRALKQAKLADKKQRSIEAHEQRGSLLIIALREAVGHDVFREIAEKVDSALSEDGI